MNDKNKKNPYQDSLNLPKTEFSIRANAAIKEPETLERWQKESLYKKTYTRNLGKKKFILHDGPPYANGHIHVGHVLNKVLKDIAVKHKRMLGFHAPVKPGWDCHGLPIELKVESQLKEKDKSLDSVDAQDFKKLCRNYAQKWVDIQKEEFQNLGVFMDWDNPYLTMNFGYESSILKALAQFVENGYIERKGKTVPWCPSCQTVLATAEIEYRDRKDPSVYVLFPVASSLSEELFPTIFESNKNLLVNFLIWTTTPWTLPLNRAVVLNNKAKYVLLKGSDDKAFIVAKDLAEKVCSDLGIEKKILTEFDSSIFEGKKAKHPFIENLQVPVILSDTVLLDEGTACVHNAPGCGPEDYVLGIKNGLEIFSPISTDGKYTEGIMPKELEGMAVYDGQFWVIKKLKELEKLLYKTSIKHSYPHCWRCKNGLIFRATEQWFCDLKKNNLVEKSLKRIESIKFFPDWGKSRLYAFTSNRTEWCISRQRKWGVPIPALLCKKCETAYINHDFIKKVASGVEKEGIEFWDRLTLQDIVNLEIVPSGFSCKGCNNSDIGNFKKEKDVLDVWFDSGVSNKAVLKKYEQELGFPADIYLEGSDQHRGWFQSSLLCSMVLNEQPPTKAFLTHGFIVDEKGYKMSKSLGNVIDPKDIIKNFSRDILRLWVSSVDYQSDIVMSENILKSISQCYRKIRNTCRFMISNLYDFDFELDAVPFDEMLKVDQFALNNLYDIGTKIIEGYDKYDYVDVFQTLNVYCTVDLSSLYLDICKDRLYAEGADSFLRRSAQTAIYQILDTITRLMAPILSFLSEEVSDFYQKNKSESIHMQDVARLIDIWKLISDDNFLDLKDSLNIKGIDGQQEVLYQSYIKSVFSLLMNLRNVVLKAIEEKRKSGKIKHSLEAKVQLYIDPTSDEKKLLDIFIKQLNESESSNRFFKDWFIVSQFNFISSKEGLEDTDLRWVAVSVEKADGNKCPRCWQWEVTSDGNKLCKRCSEVLDN